MRDLAYKIYESGTKGTLWLPCLLSLVALFIYYSGFKGQFVIDDRSYIDFNTMVHRSLLDIREIFLNPSNGWGEHLPLRDYLYLIQWNIFGESTLGYHIVSFIIFIASAWLLYFFVKELTLDYLVKDRDDIDKNTWAGISAAFVMALFLLHPMYVEVVAYISGQKDVLALFFILLSVYYLYKANKEEGTVFWKLLLLGAFFHYLAIFSKLSALATILFIPLLWVLLGDKPIKKITFRIGIWLLLNIPVLLWVQYVIGLSTQSSYYSTPFLERIPRMFNILGSHFSRSLWPTSLSFGYPHEEIWNSNVSFIVGALFVLLCIIVLTYRKRGLSMILLGLTIFGVYLTPVLQIFPELPNPTLFDRHVSMSLIGLFLILLGIFIKLFIYTKKSHWVLLVVAIVIPLSYAVKSIYYIPNFESNKKIRLHNLSEFPDWWDAQFQLAQQLIFDKELKEAKFVVQNMDPPIMSFHEKEFLLGSIYFFEADFVKAEKFLFNSMVHGERVMGYPLANKYLSDIYLFKGEFDKAKEVLLKVLNHPKKSPLEVQTAMKKLARIKEKGY